MYCLPRLTTGVKRLTTGVMGLVFAICSCPFDARYMHGLPRLTTGVKDLQQGLWVLYLHFVAVSLIGDVRNARQI